MGRPAAARHRLAGLSAAGLALAATALAGCGSSAQRKVDKTGSQLDFGIQMAQRGLWGEALFRFEQAQRDEPSARTLNNLAVAYEALGRFDDALATYRTALEISPDSRSLRQNYTRFLEFYQAFRPKKPDAAPPAPPAPETPSDDAPPPESGG